MSAASFVSGSIDFIFLDTRHDETHVAAEIEAWLPRLRVNGILGIKAGGYQDGEYIDHPGARAALTKACQRADRAVVVFDEIVSYVRW